MRDWREIPDLHADSKHSSFQPEVITMNPRSSEAALTESRQLGLRIQLDRRIPDLSDQDIAVLRQALALHGVVAKEQDEAVEGSFTLFFVPVFWVREMPAWVEDPHRIAFYVLLMFMVPYVLSGLADPDPVRAREERRYRFGCLFVFLFVFAVIHYLDANVASVDVIFYSIWDSLE